MPRRVLAQALATVLLDDLLDRVPSAAGYVSETRDRGRQVRLDHGAVQAVDGVSVRVPTSGRQESVTRVLAALGYRHRETYDLARLRMTGRSWCHLDLPTAIPQYFVSVLHAGLFSPLVPETPRPRCWAPREDPLDPASSHGD